MENEDFLWAGIPFMGGIASHQKAPCGAVSASAVCLGLRYRCDISDKEKAKHARTASRHYSGKLVRDFDKEFGDITCIGLLDLDFSKPGAYQEFRESGIWKDKCNRYIEYIIEQLYGFEDGEAAEGTAS
ncbi:MAG: C_GCAxxG_C_C family protein [Deltaproteobacteria bacterium]|nr:C_GCAxxG_C_C family protein [Deltaproteobacteria bacterium]